MLQKMFGIKYMQLFLFLVVLLQCMQHNAIFVSGKVQCIAREREALLLFKQGLIDDFGVLKSWGSQKDNNECCNWYGVRCNNATGHVVALQLGCNSFTVIHCELRGEIRPALLQLNRLSYLDLSFNDFGGARIPEFLGSMKALQHLKLSSSNFLGSVPNHIGNLTKLKTLGLAWNSLAIENTNWLSRLSSLSQLDLSGLNISDVHWPRSISMLHSLQELRMVGCSLKDGVLSKDLFLNSSLMSLSTVLLTENNLTSSIFDWLFNVSTKLVEIKLLYNQLGGSIPDSFEKLNNLEYLYLSYNMVEGGIPKSLGSLTRLRVMDLSENVLSEPLVEIARNLSCKELEYLGLNGNRLTGSIPDFSSCLTLTELRLQRNKLQRVLPTSFSHLTKLEELDVSYNSLEGTISEVNFMNLHSLQLLDLSFNALTMRVSPEWTPPFQLDSIALASCKLGLHFPTWLRTQVNLSLLDISNAGISDELPTWLWNYSSNLYSVNISHNEFVGAIPDLSRNYIPFLDISFNKFSGPLPSFHPNTSIFLLSSNMFSGPISSICGGKYAYEVLVMIDVSYNQLFGELPDCWENMKALRVLNLGNNYFSGRIPYTIGSLQELVTLHLQYNSLSGELPSTLRNCRNLKLMNVGGNSLSGNVPRWIGTLGANMKYLIFRDNKFYGDIPLEVCNLTQIQVLDLSLNSLSGKLHKCFNGFTSLVQKNGTILKNIDAPYVFNRAFEYTDPYLPEAYVDYALVQWKGQESEYKKTLGLLKLIDLSSNKLGGSIPREIFSLTGLISLNLSRNYFRGKIHPDIGTMERLESLDLSRNELSGTIPDSLARLHLLSTLDLSYNNLSGKIPTGTQLQSFDESVYGHNAQLCGKPLTLCLGDGLIQPPRKFEENDEERNGFMRLSFVQDLCMSMGLGFVFGFWGIIGSLLLSRSWRIAYFGFFDGVGNLMYVKTAIFLNKIKMKLN